MKCTTAFVSSCEDGIDARLVLAGGERRSLEFKAMRFICGASGGQHVRAWKIGRRRSNETPVNVKLHLDVARGRGFVQRPAIDVLRGRFVERTTKKGVEGCQIETDGERSDKQRFKN